MSNRLTEAGLALVLLVTAPAVYAHTGSGPAGFTAGLTHPWLGIDHLLAMVAVGAWAVTARLGQRLIVPAMFLTGMAAGAALGAYTGASVLAEIGIAASLVGAGGLVLARRSLPLGAAASLATLFALGHGHAHGAEAGGQPLTFGVGMLVATALLHALGLGLATLAVRSRAAETGLRLAGAATAGVGLLALAGLAG